MFWKEGEIVDGHIQKYKARLVAGGFTQIQGVDFDDTYAPVYHTKTIKVLLAASVVKECILDTAPP